MMQEGDVMSAQSQQEFSNWLPRIGEGTKMVYPQFGANAIHIPPDMCIGCIPGNTGMVHTYAGQKVTASTTDRRPFCTIFLHTTSSKRCDNQPQHTRTGKNTATMVAEPPSTPATWS